MDIQVRKMGEKVACTLSNFKHACSGEAAQPLLSSNDDMEAPHLLEVIGGKSKASRGSKVSISGPVKDGHNR